jgi:hypothetical protein
LGFLKQHVQKMSPLSKATLACTSPTTSAIQCVVIRVNPVHAMQEQRATSIALLSLNVYDGTLSLAKILLSLPIPTSLKKFIYNKANKMLGVFYKIAEDHTSIVRKSKKTVPVQNWFLVDIYNFHTKE